MKIYRIAETWQDKRTLYSDKTGYIKGFQADDGRWWVMEFVINPEYRGKGFSRELAKHIPEKSRVYVQPLDFKKGGKEILDHRQLISFYQSLGFKNMTDNAFVMERG